MKISSFILSFGAYVANAQNKRWRIHFEWTLLKLSPIQALYRLPQLLPTVCEGLRHPILQLKKFNIMKKVT